MSRVPVPKRYFTVLSKVENWMCKWGYRATFFGTRAIFIRAVPEVFGSVNWPYKCKWHQARKIAFESRLVWV